MDSNVFVNLSTTTSSSVVDFTQVINLCFSAARTEIISYCLSCLCCSFRFCCSYCFCYSCHSVCYPCSCCCCCCNRLKMSSTEIKKWLNHKVIFVWQHLVSWQTKKLCSCYIFPTAVYINKVIMMVMTYLSQAQDEIIVNRTYWAQLSLLIFVIHKFWHHRLFKIVDTGPYLWALRWPIQWNIWWCVLWDCQVMSQDW